MRAISIAVLVGMSMWSSAGQSEAGSVFSIQPSATNQFQPYIAIPVGSWPEAVAIGDVNNDGLDDVVMTTSFYFDPANDYHLFVFTQNVAGGLNAPIKYLTRGTYLTRPVSVDVGDINNDGRNDVVVGNSGESIEVFTQNPLGELNASVFYPTVNSSKVRIADLNNDGLPDVAGVGPGTLTADVLIQNLGGTLDAPVTYSVMHGGNEDLEIGDVNSDGLQDIIVMSGALYAYQNVGVLIQDVSGVFLPAAYYNVGPNILTQGLAVGDVTGDSREDVVVTFGGNRPNSTVGVFAQNASGTLNPVVSYPSYDIPEAAEIADVDNDGRNDLVVLHGGWMQAGVYIQGVTGHFQTETFYPIPYASHYNPHGLSLGDINNDGQVDMVIADYNYGLVILYHRPATPVPDIKANGQDGLVTIAQGSPLAVTVALDASGMAGQNADWWVLAETATKRYWYQYGTGWVQSMAAVPAYGGPLFNLPAKTILNSSSLPAGTYFLYFAVDSNMDGVPDGTWTDAVTVNIL